MSESEDVYTGDDVGISDDGTEAGASGQDSGGNISQGAMIAIIVVVVTVSVIGSTSIPSQPLSLIPRLTRTPPKVASAVLFFLAKKREWKVRENLRKSARKVVTALTPRRTEFPRELKDGGGPRSKHRARLDDVPPTPKLKPEDLEKGLAGKWGARKMRFGAKEMRFGDEENPRSGYR